MSSPPIAMPAWIKTAPRLDAEPVAGFVAEAFVASDTYEIAAPASIVWEILTDFANYSDWNPFCVRAEAKLEMGSPVVMKLVTPIAHYLRRGEVASWFDRGFDDVQINWHNRNSWRAWASVAASDQASA